MEGRWGLGPVFASEWQIGARSPRAYATRAGFVIALLVVLVAVWSSVSEGRGPGSLRDFAEAGSDFYFALVGTQLALILLAAPAATAGAICLDRSRGTLTHLLVTDLSDPEIVLGKLAARLVPTLSLVLCALPVQFLASLLGGIDPVALMGSTLVALGVATFACSLALTLSVWGRKTQEVLIATYLFLAIWLLVYPMVAWSRGVGSWAWRLDPFQLALAPYSSEPASAGWPEFVGFFALMVAGSAALVFLSVRKFRAVAARGDRPRRDKPRREWRLLNRFRPTLDADPIFWREAHRARPSPWSRATWWSYYAMAAIFGGLAILYVSPNNVFTLFVVGLGSAIGLLLLSVDSATSLAEERARGSLDVLMTTPLSTRSIVWGKWRGGFRRVFGIALMPTIVILFALDGGKRWLGASMVLGLMLAYGAAITSLGLALATWVPRLGRAVGFSVGIYILVTVGGFFLCFAQAVPAGWESEFAAGSPFYGPIYPLENGLNTQDLASGPLVALSWATFYTLAAATLLLATLATFDRCLGRAREVGGSDRLQFKSRNSLSGGRINPGINASSEDLAAVSR